MVVLDEMDCLADVHVPNYIYILCSKFVPPSGPQVQHISAGEDDHDDKEVGESV